MSDNILLKTFINPNYFRWYLC